MLRKRCYSFLPVLLLLCFNIVSHFCVAQQYHWLKLIGGTHQINVRDIVQKDGFVYITGGYKGAATFGSTVFTSVSPVNYTSGSDIFFAKYDTLGNLIWAKTFGNADRNIGQKIAVDTNGDIFLFGRSDDITYFDNLVLPATHVSNRDQFLLKLNSSGQAVWVKNISISSSFYNSIIDGFEGFTSSIKISNQGRLYLSSNFACSDTSKIKSLFYDGQNTMLNTLEGIYLFQIDKANGALIHSKLIANPNPRIIVDQSRLGGMTTDSEGNVVISGFYSGIMKVDNFTLPTLVYPNEMMFVVKIDSSNTVQWLKTSQTIYISRKPDPKVRPMDLQVDQSNNIYIGGKYETYFSYGGVAASGVIDDINPFLIKLNPQGNLIYLKTFKSDTSTIEWTDWIYRLAVDQDNNLFGIGTFTNNMVLENQVLQSYGGRDAFIFKLDSSGNKLWAMNAGGGSDDEANAIALDQNGLAYVSGNYNGLASFGNTVVNSINSSDNGFIAKLGECGTLKPSIAALGDTTFCGPGSVRLVTSNGVGFQYQWLKNGGILPGETFSDFLAINSGSYAVIVNSNGCIDTTEAIMVRIGTVPPTVSLNLSDSVCANVPAFNLTGGMPLGGTYKGAAVINNQFYPSLATIGTNAVRYVADSVGCADSSFSSVLVKTAPTPVINGLKSMCSNTTGVAYSTNSVGPIYSWSAVGGTITSGQGTNSILVDWGGAGNGQLTLQETNAEGCPAEVQEVITIASQQFVGKIVGEDSVCTNNRNKNYSVAAPSLFYNWSITGGVITNGQGSSQINVQWNTSTQGTLAVRLFNSCGSDTTFYDTIKLFQSPTPTISGLNTLCYNESSVYTVPASGGTYQWVLGADGNVITGQGTPQVELGWSTSGSKQIKLIETSPLGCLDSTTYTVLVHPESATTLNASVCQGETHSFAGFNLGVTGTYYDTLVNGNNCDSIVRLNLTVLPTFASSLNQSICFGESFNFNGQVINAPGLYFDTSVAINGCDSILTLSLSVLPISDNSISATICQNTQYSFGGKSPSTAGSYKDTIPSINGCDSIITLTLTVDPVSQTSLNETICFEETFDFNGQLLTATGNYLDTLIAANGCDSIIALTLTKRHYLIDSVDVSICDGASYGFNGLQLSQSGKYLDTLMASTGCDSIVQLNLTVLGKANSSITASICQGDFYPFNGQSLTATGVYLDTLMASNSCDSIVQLNLTVLGIINNNVTAAICQGDAYFFKGQNISVAGNYSDTLNGSNGCDSIVDLTLSILSNFSDTSMVSICNGTSYIFGGIQLSQSGSYVDTVPAVNGCDSILHLDLTVLGKVITSVSSTICEGDFYLFNGQNLTNTGIYSDTLVAAFGCDSVVNLNLTVLPVTRDSLSVSLCSVGSYSFNGKALTNSGIYSDTLTSSNGCDSIVRLDLLLDSVEASISRLGYVLTANQGGVSYQWFECNQGFVPIVGETFQTYTVTKNGSYAVSVQRNSCVDTTDNCETYVSVGIMESEYTQRDFEVSPNPTKGQLKITFYENELTAIRIYNSYGQLIKEFIPKSSIVDVDMSSFSNGLYYVHYKRQIKKIVLSK